MYDGRKHVCLEDSHIVNIFSFSKAYGMMGWRVGYIAYPSEVEGLAAQLLKVQDNIPICASIISQRLALHSLEMGRDWVTDQVKDLIKNRELVLEALSPLGKDSVRGGEGAIYLWAKLPDKYHDDFEVVRWLARKHGIVIIPGSSSGCPGYVRISFGGLMEEDCQIASDRLRKGLEELVNHGMRSVGKEIEAYRSIAIPTALSVSESVIEESPNPSAFSQFHPISLCNFTNKIISKVISARISSVLSKIISENQSAFGQRIYYMPDISIRLMRLSRSKSNSISLQNLRLLKGLREWR
ncbi:hypothetical protein M9H77_29353 [Catharanthus roseus]|uniref:Uncharacterized protein n=1 Tax=Catharanthus roseus TaxID=4058 RepID=A0ACC0AJW8_CATRO|nr:hypothetical protein M9H77_29353 [Catharanthus roseus]